MIADGLSETPFPGALASFRTKLIWDLDHVIPTTARSDLQDVLARFQRSTGGAWQPACSLWAQLYFNTLLIPAVCLLASDVGWIHRAVAIGATFCPVSGVPLFCAVQTDDRARGGGWSECLARHLDAMIIDLNMISRLSKGLLRESAARTMAWTLDEISLVDMPRAKAAAVRLSQHGGHWTPESLDRNLRAVRKFCCLRDRLPNNPSCGGICPRGKPHASRQIGRNP